MKSGTPSQRHKAAAHQLAAGIATMPNFSSAVSAQRFEPRDSLDDFPTPTWGARAWVEYVAGRDAVSKLSCWEPAANRGYLLRGLSEYFQVVAGSDIADYGAGFPIHDFLSDDSDLLSTHRPVSFKPDFVVTNPPFNRLLDFTERALFIANVGVAMFCRLQALEGVDRYKRIFAPYQRQWCFSQFVERISLVRGCVDPKAGRPAAYGWLTIWKEEKSAEFLLDRRHIPPCRKKLERDNDYPQETKNPAERGCGSAGLLTSP